ncbi:MAG: prenyltransferase [Candidatus Omnitrophica bacterium]|nr:prenyltransferase [Candidatus Omnitrophota bacterium]
MKINFKDFIRALRLSFIPASILPFILGSLLPGHNFNALNFFLGLVAVVFVHLSANLANDYADSKSGLDWQDKKFYNFFGGSKLIQEGVLSEKFYFWLAVFFSISGALCVIALSLIFKSPSVVAYFAVILFLAWSYSEKPLQFSYHGMGEAIIFILFGPALVMGGYFIQTGIFPDLKSFMVSLPVGFLITAVLFANEIPDYPLDTSCGKRTWVSFLGQERSYIIYVILIVCAFMSISLNFTMGYLNIKALISFVFILPALKAAAILRRQHTKPGFIQSSKLTIMVHACVSAILILSVIR